MQLPEDTDFFIVDHYDENLYQKALNWVRENRRAIFISDEEKISEHPQIKIFHLESPLQLEPIAKKIGWSTVFKKIHVVGNRLKERIETSQMAAHLILSDAAHYWKQEIENGKVNSAPYRRGLDFVGAFKNIPAIIVGAGPSLKKNGHLLKEFKDRALIFAGGSALHSIDIPPHFAGAVDKEAPNQRLAYNTAPFLYQARMNSDLFSQVQGERILFPDSSSHAINWLYREQELFDGGWTVGNFLTRGALLMGCSPIIFVGMDYSYEEGRKYASLENNETSELIEFDGKFTQKDWLMAKKWTEDLAASHELINATQGGILDLKEETLENLLRLLPKKCNLENLVESQIHQRPIFNVTRLKEWETSLLKCKQFPELREEEAAYEMLLKPLWQIWSPIFEREVERDPNQKIKHHQEMFFHNVLAELVVESDWVNFYENGSLKTVKKYDEEGFLKEAILYWPNGALKRRTFFSNEKREGKDEMFNEEGSLMDVGFYHEGKPIGMHRRYNDEGQLVEEIEYLDPCRFNLKSWDDEGNLKVEAQWVSREEYEERVWDRFQNEWIEKKGRFDGKKLVYL